MSSLPIPKTVIEAIDRRRRAFISTGEERCSGSRCLISWDKAMLAPLEGGLGVKDLATQNHCLLLKFIHKLFQGPDILWQRWVLRDIGEGLGNGIPTSSFIGHLVHQELEQHRSLTRVHVHNGWSASFWFDDWVRASSAEIPDPL